MKAKRIITALLSLSMLAGTVVTTTSAANTTGTGSTSKTATTAQTEETEKKTLSHDDYLNEEGDPIYDYMNGGYDDPEQKIATMGLVYETDRYQLYYEFYTGEVMCKDVVTGQMLWSNPYDLAGSSSLAAAATKQRLLSQIMLTYQFNGSSYTMISYNDAADKNQIKFKKIKNGIRVEYTMGDEITKRLVPRLIDATRYEELIASKIPKSDAIAYARMGCKMIYDNDDDGGFYLYYDITDPSYTERKILEIIDQFPYAERGAFYVLDPDISSKRLAQLESYVIKYAPNYTYDELDYDHELTGYVSKDENPPLFRMALEYTITDTGLEVRLPANGIRFDESTYQLTSISVLPWMGAGRSGTTESPVTGYTFIPDGSGSLIRFEDVSGEVYNVSGQMYGPDFAYHEISGQHAETMRFPVYGVIEDTTKLETSVVNGTIVREKVAYSRGYCAIITEGDTMASLMSTHGGNTHMYNSVYPSFNPRPYDSYNLADSISIGKDATWTVTSSRKYNGSYRIKYIMLLNEADATSAGLKSGEYYDASYVGMAKAYQDYLVGNGTLTRLTNDDVEKDIPLYIESFGSIKTSDRFLTIPITVDTPLTTFEDVTTMYNELSDEGITNINFRLRGFANGGMKSTVPAKLKWVKAVGGADGFSDLVSYSKEKGFGVYPDFDFAYINDQERFDGLNLKRDAVRTIDNRYTSKRYYDAASQTFENDFALALSPSVYEYFYEKLNREYSKYEPTGISVSTLGSDLNSDFDQDDPYNREDSKNFTNALLSRLGEDGYKVMIDAGNAYTFPYADYILNMATESSKYMKASESIPFIGMVLHGYIQTAGTALNMEGDIETAVLRAIENGSGLYFILSYRNTEMLKEDSAYSSYYSVGYDTWKSDVIKYYNMLNENLADLQTSLIVDHEFIPGARIPDEDEVAADAEQKVIDDEAAKAESEEQARLAELERLRQERRAALGLPAAETPAASTDDDTDSGDNSTDNTTTGGTDSASNEVEIIAGLDSDPKYYTVSGTVVRVEYENGASFILNYNSFDIKAEYNGQTYEVGALSFIRVN